LKGVFQQNPAKAVFRPARQLRPLCDSDSRSRISNAKRTLQISANAYARPWAVI